jgi:hypothetical protein
MKRMTIIVFMLICSAIIVFGEGPSVTKTGTTAASFLKIGVGARSIAMGGAFTAVADDITAFYWNPAGLARMKSNEALFNHVNWIADIKYDVGGAAIQIEGFGSLGVMFGILNIGEMERTTIELPEGTGETFKAGGSVIGLSYAKNLTDRFSIGFNAKYIREFIWNESASSFALDLGTLYEAPVMNGLRIGASMSNFGPKMRMEGRDVLQLLKTGPGGQNLVNSSLEMESYELPLLFRVGLSTDIIKDDNSKLILAVDAIHPNDNTEYVNSGVEYRWANMVSVRGGWKSAFERGGEQGLTLGGGIEYSLENMIGVLFDYAYMDFGRLKEVHYFTVGLKF